MAITVAVMAAGCQPSEQGEPATRPAVRQKRPPGPAPLPPQAILSLDAIEPKITAPRNPPDFQNVPERAKPLVDQADKLIARGNHAAAVEKLERAIGFAPGNTWIHRQLGLAYAGMGNAAKADDHLRRAVTAAPDDLEAQLTLGRISAEQKQYDRSLLALRTATNCTAFKAENPPAAVALLMLAGVLDAQDYWQAALESYTRLSDWIDEHGRSYISEPRLKSLVLRPQRLLAERGRLLLLLRRGDEAAEMLQLAFARDRSHPRTADLLTETLIANGDFSAAEELMVALADEPSQRRQLPALVEKVCLSAGDAQMPQRIWQAFRAKRHDTVDTDLATSLARTAYRLGGPQQAVTILEALMDEMPGSTAAGALLSQMYGLQGHFEEAFRLLGRLLADSPDSASAMERAAAAIAVEMKDKTERRLAAEADKEKSARKPALHYLAAVIASRRGSEELAIEQLKKAIAAKADFLPAYELLVDLLLARKQIDEAERVGRQLRKLDEDHYLAYYLQGKVRLARREVRPAADALKQAVAENEDYVPARLVLAWAHERAGDRASAERILAEAANKFPVDAEICRALLDLHVRRRRSELAEAIIRRFLISKPASLAGRIIAAELDLLAGNVANTKLRLADLLKENPNDINVMLLAIEVETYPSQGLLYRRQHERIVQSLSRILQIEPDNVAAGRLLARVLLAAGEEAKAADALGRLSRWVGEDVDVERSYLSALVLAGRFAEGLEIADGLLQENPDDMIARGAALDCLAGLDRFDEAMQRARQWLQTAEDEKVRFLHRWRMLGLCEKAKRYDKAQEVLDDWIAAEPGRKVPLQIQKLLLYRRAKEYDEAIAYARRRIDDLGDETFPRGTLADVLIEAKAYDKLEPLLKAWIGGRKDESVEPYREALIFAIARGGRSADALKLAQEWMDAEPYNISPRRGLIGAMVEQDKHREAMKLVDKWLKALAPQAATTKPEGYDKLVKWCRMMAINTLIRREKCKDAIKRIDELLRADPTDHQMLELRSTCYAELGKTRQAVADLEAAYKLAPDEVGPNNNLGYMYADMGVKLDQAEQMIRKALSKTPDAASVQDSLGWVLYKKGKVRQAGGIFAAIVRARPEGAPEHPVIYDHAGDAFYRLGWRDKASRMWQLAVDSAKKQEHPTREARNILSSASRKLRDLKARRTVKVAPLGEGVSQESPD